MEDEVGPYISYEPGDVLAIRAKKIKKSWVVQYLLNDTVASIYMSLPVTFCVRFSIPPPKTSSSHCGLTKLSIPNLSVNRSSRTLNGCRLNGLCKM